MKKFFICTIPLMTSLAVLTGCAQENFNNNITIPKSERVIEYEKKEKFKKLEKNIGLENIEDKKISDLLLRSYALDKSYQDYRGKKIKKELLNEKNIYECADRAHYFADIYFNEPNNYIYMKNFNDIDSLGYFISKDLALKLLGNCIKFGDIPELVSKIKNNDSNLYYYNYIVELLVDYYKTTSDFSEEEKDIVLSFLFKTATFAQFELNNKNEEISKHVREPLINSFNDAKFFLENNTK